MSDLRVVCQDCGFSSDLNVVSIAVGPCVDDGIATVELVLRVNGTHSIVFDLGDTADEFCERLRDAIRQRDATNDVLRDVTVN